MEEEANYEQTRENSSYSQVTIDEKLEEIAALMDSKFGNMIQQIQQLLPKVPDASSPNLQENQENSLDPLDTPSRLQNSMLPRQSRQSRQAQFEDANFRHRAQQNTTQSDTSIETTSPVASSFCTYKRGSLSKRKHHCTSSCRHRSTQVGSFTDQFGLVTCLQVV
jgi:hypothetical protein